jgi:hypothetical protein
MKPYNIRKKMLEIIKMNEDELAQKLFNDESFVENYHKTEVLYGDYLLKTGKKMGSLQLNPLSKEHSNHVVMVTPSARVKGEWQRTIFWDTTPMSHREYQTMEELVAENVGDWFQHALWVEGNSNQ